MKRRLLTLAAISIYAAMASTTTYAQEQEEASPYFSIEDMPDLLKWLPAPPDTMSTQFVNDIMQYMWGKSMRQDPERSAIAIRDAVYGMETICNEFSVPFGLELSKAGTPEIYRLLKDGLTTMDFICIEPKKYYMRKRPFVRMNEPTSTPWDEEYLEHSGSYPSGHTILGWGAALLLMEINPAKADTILSRGMMYGESRVIVGAHWQSDVDAGRLAASVAYAKLHTSPRFIAQMKKAQAEFKMLTEAKDTQKKDVKRRRRK